MAAPVVQSSSSSAWASGSPVTLTKPTGLTTGDLMVAYIASVSTAGNTVDAPSTPAGWTNFSAAFYDGASDTHRVYGFWKEADAGDAAASNFQWTVDSSDAEHAGFLMRIDGQASGGEIADTDFDDDSGIGQTNPTVTASIDPMSTDALLVMAWVSRDGDLTSAVTGSNYSVTGITNPTWTEQYEEFATDNGFIVATATSGATGTITAIEFDVSLASDNWVGSITSIPAPTPVTVTPDSISLVAANTDPDTKVKVNLTPDSVALVNSVSGSTNEAYTKTWTTTPKS